MIVELSKNNENLHVSRSSQMIQATQMNHLTSIYCFSEKHLFCDKSRIVILDLL